MGVTVAQLVEWMIGRGNRSTQRKPAPVPLWLPQKELSKSLNLTNRRFHIRAVFGAWNWSILYKSREPGLSVKNTYVVIAKECACWYVIGQHAVQLSRIWCRSGAANIFALWRYLSKGLQAVSSSFCIIILRIRAHGIRAIFANRNCHTLKK
jgi:hypothetical protein